MRFRFYLVLVMLVTVGLVACSKDSPTEPTDSKREKFCFDHAEQCSWFDAGLVKLSGHATVVPQAKGLVISNATQESHPFTTDYEGKTRENLWIRGYDPQGTLWITVEPGIAGGINYERYDRKDVVPVCTAHPDVDKAMLCAWTAELTIN